jgi:hypothetical protein
VYETSQRRLASRQVFAARLLAHFAVSSALIAVSLLIGVLGYHGLEGLPWIDALLNASMLMGGMGPVDTLHTTAGKLFASGYALYCGLVLLIAAGILLAPIIHRVLHRFHLESGRDR